MSSLIADRTDFWWSARQPNAPSLWESRIELGEKFFNEIITHPIPLDMNILRAITRLRRQGIVKLPTSARFSPSALSARVSVSRHT